MTKKEEKHSKHYYDNDRNGIVRSDELHEKTGTVSKEHKIAGTLIEGHIHDINTILNERGSNYGSFESHASLSQDLKNTLQNHKNWTRLDADKKESLEMVMHKVARIVNGDSNYKDSWTDIIGYTKLIEDRL